MKTRLLQMWRVGLLPLVAAVASGCAQNGTATPPNAANLTTNTVAAAASAPADAAPVVEIPENAPPPERAEPAPVSVPHALPADLKLSPNTVEVVKLARSGVDGAVMLAFVTNSTGTFNLGSDQIVYLNDLGVASEVLTSMIEHDRLLREGAGALPPIAPAAMTAVVEPAYSDPTAVAAAAAPQALEQPQSAWAEPPPAAAVAQEVPAPPANVTYNYFYNSLSPYGTWVDVEGYGYCWQPTVAVVNVGWRPYVHSGRWIYSTYGWYWHSDYSWGWAPFHYGRWFSHPRWGWCWRPDTIWGPSWVSWRYTDGYCGWAPLPPAAMYSTGMGFTYYGSSVGFSFGFGLTPYCYAFVPWQQFHGRHYHRHTVPAQHARTIYNNSTVVNNIIVGNNNTIINRGIEVERVSRFTKTEIQPVRVREVSVGNNSRLQPGERLERGGRELVVQRPRLPESPAAAPARLGREEPRQVSTTPRPNMATSLSGASASAPSGPRVTTPTRAERSREQAEQNRARVETALRGQRPVTPAPSPEPAVVPNTSPVPVASAREIRRQEQPAASAAPVAAAAPRSASALLTPPSPAPSVPAKLETTPPKNEVMPPGSVTWIGRREPTPATPRVTQPAEAGNPQVRTRPNTTTTLTQPTPVQPRTTVIPRGSAPTPAPITRPTPPAPGQPPAATVTPPRVAVPQPVPAVRQPAPRMVVPSAPPPARNYTPPATPSPRVMTPPAPAPRSFTPPAANPPAPNFAPRPAPAPPAVSVPARGPGPSVAPAPRMESRPAPAAPSRPSGGGPIRSDEGRGGPRPR